MRTALAGLLLLALFCLGGWVTTLTDGNTEPARNRPPVTTDYPST